MMIQIQFQYYILKHKNNGAGTRDTTADSSQSFPDTS